MAGEELLQPKKKSQNQKMPEIASQGSKMADIDADPVIFSRRLRSGAAGPGRRPGPGRVRVGSGPGPVPGQVRARAGRARAGSGPGPGAWLLPKKTWRSPAAGSAGRGGVA